MATIHVRAFEVEGADGGPLRGDIRTVGDGTDRPAVVICHGFKGFKDWGFFPRIATRLANAGITSVSINFSGSGVGPDGERFSEPDRFARGTISQDLEDLASIWTRLSKGRLVPGLGPPTAMGLFGHSRGGGTAILFVASGVTCGALVTWAAISRVRRWDDVTIDEWRARGTLPVVNSRTGEVLSLATDYLDDMERHGMGRLDIGRAAAEVTAPWLILHGELDETVAVAEGDYLASRAGATAVYRRIPGGSHTFGARHPWAESTPELDDAMDATVGWMVENLV